MLFNSPEHKEKARQAILDERRASYDRAQTILAMEEKQREAFLKECYEDLARWFVSDLSVELFIADETNRLKEVVAQGVIEEIEFEDLNSVILRDEP